MSLGDRIKDLARRLDRQRGSINTEQATKNAFVLPFLTSLGYDVFDPDVVVPEFTADVGVKKGEKVDYAIKHGDQIIILIECKALGVELGAGHASQLYRYFSVTSARIALLTNGECFQFFSDLEEPNKMDERPFFEFEIGGYTKADLAELEKFTSDKFELENILSTANTLKYVSLFKDAIASETTDPSEELVRLLAYRFFDGRFTKAVLDEFTPIVKVAFQQTMREQVDMRLTSALNATGSDPIAPSADTEPSTSDGEEVSGDGIETTAEEMEGFFIVRSIARWAIDSERVCMRDAKSYCAILIDNNNRKPLVRLHFNRSQKYIGLFRGKEEERVPIERLDQIYDYSDRIQATASGYAESSG